MVLEAFSQVWEWSGRPPGGPGNVGTPSGRVRKLSRRSRRGQEALLEARERSGGPSEGLGGVMRPSRRTERGREGLPEVREGS